MITVMTPTFNRAYILEEAYNSLCNQTSYDFEWIIIDDGSTDNTEQIVNNWVITTREFNITYFKQPNGGKHRAVNRAAKMAHYEWFLILDSDDQLEKNAIKRIHKWISDVKDNKEIVGVAGLRGTYKQIIGENPKHDFVDATNLERGKYGLLGDKAEIYKTDILKKYPFPEFDGENFIRESAVWDRIAKDGLKLRWYNELIYICEYIEDGLTKNTDVQTYKNNFKGYTYCSKLFIDTHSGILSLHKCGEFYNVAKLKGLGKRDAAHLLGISYLTLLIGMAIFDIKPFFKKLRNLGGKQ